MPERIRADEITGLVLAGGRGLRMGGIDKGLQPFQGTPLAQHALQRLGPQVGPLLLSANRNLAAYRSFGVPVLSDDSLAGHAGPLAGFLAGLERCETPYLLTVPCDTPLFPLDLAERLGTALAGAAADIAMASANGNADTEAARSTVPPEPKPQPVFCLLRRDLLDSLQRFTAGGGRKVGQWVSSHRALQVRFDRPDDAPEAFFNANTLAELHALEALQS